ncbi:DUF2878 domain-containing protein [Gilvimarinus sp. SDUM040013]|uniref:DUF2878 domain-containing protein n=1 Tax=Gilvimarinus gilvus TaxID=3058038 RepID=A0ABU4S3S9_9GAMM|nr:DUF2878 domain-containing protein [Gilvimarinus sp. SDUM040013]MDO3385572.1 DUF2878 domain-containing protein [Gilvimarinus sp. SDUM040013]MDX6851177.1 DUF2878 domain-containing protein [Gilvimarinus sp. SDUM040013]
MNRLPWLFTAANVLLFQVGWAVAVLLGSKWALCYTVTASALHFWKSHSPRFDLLSALLLVVLGIVHDSLLLNSGILIIGEARVPPIWLMAIWFLMGLTLNHSLKFIYERWIWSAVLGSMGSVFAYSAGVKLSGASWGVFGFWGLACVAALWVFVLPLHKVLMSNYLAGPGRVVNRGSAQ